MDLERERAERPGREIVIYDAQGEVLGQAPARPIGAPGHGPLEFQVTTRDGQTLFIQLPRPHRPPSMSGMPGMSNTPGVPGKPGMEGRPPEPMGFLVMLMFISLAVALGTYPVVRWLTLRLERLQQGVERWGQGDLSVRLPVQGHDEVAFLAERFNVAAERVQAVVQSHKALLANASHELRSPLARIRMGLELMDASTPTQRHIQRQEIARNIAELDQLIDEILLASRMDAADAPALHLETIDLTGLAAEECARTGAQLTVQAQPMLQGDARLLRRLLRNLLENARRYGAAASSVTPATEASDAESGVVLTLDQFSQGGVLHARVTVDDRGPGVPEAMRQRIFEPFFRLAGASERDGGVGLGLALVQTIARQHGGTVRCEGRPGGGARFVVELPTDRQHS
jgi:signal transduction histidine kinase